MNKPFVNIEEVGGELLLVCADFCVKVNDGNINAIKEQLSTALSRIKDYEQKDKH